MVRISRRRKNHILLMVEHVVAMVIVVGFVWLSG